MTHSLVHISNWATFQAEKPLKVWVLSPLLTSADENIDYYYDFTQSIEEYTRVFNTLKLNWKWQPVTLTDFRNIIDEITFEKNEGVVLPVVFNLCDGDEINGTPGVSVIDYLEEKELIYTGANRHFYEITTSKIPMKKAFDRHGVANAEWCVLKDIEDAERLLQQTGGPLIVKPAVSGGSMGVSTKNVIDNTTDLSALLDELTNGYRGWNLMADGLIAEQFIQGPEFTVLICGHHLKPDEIRIYCPVERVFHPSLPEKEKFLSFDRLWEIYENESAMPEDGNFYDYRLPNENIISDLKNISQSAFIATGGVGYARADIRMDAMTGKLFMIEINAQCGISEDENYTSIGAILRFAHIPFHQLVEDILNNAFENHIHLVVKEKMKTLPHLNNGNA